MEHSNIESSFNFCLVEAMIEAGARVEESHVLACMLRGWRQLVVKLFGVMLESLEYLSCQRAYSISLNSHFLEHLRSLFNHPNNGYVQLALDFLDMVVENFGESIRHGLLSKQHYIGVDVAAESRYERCMKCRNGLMQIRLNSAFICERMNDKQKRTMEHISKRIDEIVDA